MTRHELPIDEQEQLSLYAFGLLTDAQAAEVEQRLQTDVAWRDELRAMQDSLASLTEPVGVPAGSAESLLARVRAEGREGQAPANLPLPPTEPEDAPRPRAPYGPFLALLLAAAVVAGVLLLPRLNTPERQLARYEAQPGAVTTPLATKAGQNLGTAVRLNDGRVFVLLAEGAPAGRAYQAWQVIGAAPESLGVFDGRSFLTQPLPGKVTLAVSVEPPAGSKQPTTTPILLQEL